MTARVLARWVLGFVCGLAVAVGVIFLGPKTTQVCDNVGWPNSIFGDMFGAVDGSSFSGCDVPSTLAWIIAVVALVGVTAAIGLRRPGRTAIDGHGA